jgi:hypothetical protein
MNFQYSWGSVTGTSHYRLRKNGQDALSTLQLPDLFVGFVTDGCGDPIDSPYSEVGARIGARMAVKTVSEHARKLLPYHTAYLSTPQFWARIQEAMLSQLKILALTMGENLSEVISKHFLFTMIGTVITPEMSVFVSLGDGFIIINGDVHTIGPFPGNMPVYLAYNLIPTKLTLENPDALNFTVQRPIRTSELNSFLIGCDGIEDLIQAADQPIPGKEELVGPISQFWENQLYFTNPFAASHRLKLLAEDKRIINWEEKFVDVRKGLLSDDTTFIAGAKIPTEEDDTE